MLLFAGAAVRDTMDKQTRDTCYLIASAVSLLATALLLSPPLAAQSGQFVVSPVVEKKLAALPPGPLYWRIENFPRLDQAQGAAAASPTSLAAEISGKVWLFTLGPLAGQVSQRTTHGVNRTDAGRRWSGTARYGDGSCQQQDHRPRSTRDVSAGRHQTCFGASQA
jgi:hypothetical protein